MNVKGIRGEWWIVGVPEYEADGEIHTSCGPYETKGAAESDCRGLTRSYKQLGIDVSNDGD